MHGGVAPEPAQLLNVSSRRAWWRAAHLVDRARPAAGRLERLLVAELARAQRGDRQPLRARGDVPLAREPPLEVEHRVRDGHVQREGAAARRPLLRSGSGSG